MENRNLYVYDIETIAGVFTYIGINPDTEEIVKYVIHKDRDDSAFLRKHLMDISGMIGFNNLDFDYPVLHCFLENCLDKDASETIDILYKKAQDIIDYQGNIEEYNRFNPHLIKEKYIKIPQLDLYKLWHFNNSARRTSLKALEISMNFPNVMEMPIHHSQKDIPLDLIDEILEYNENDVRATLEFYKQSKDKIDLRKQIKRKYGLNCLSWNNGKIGENLILKLYCDEIGADPWEIKKLRTKRSSISLKDCIPDIIRFKSKEFNELLEFFRNKVIIKTKGSVEYSVIYKEHKYDFGTGGEHGIHRPGVYHSNDKYVIKTADVASLHPNLPLVFNFYPEHLGPIFLKVYGNNIVKVRLAEKAKPKKDQDKAIIDGYKEAANIPYG